MKATGYIQIVPVRRRNGSVASLRIGRLTKNFPADPEPGALVTKLEVDVDEKVFAIPTMAVGIDGDPTSLGALVVPVPVPEEELEDD